MSFRHLLGCMTLAAIAGVAQIALAVNVDYNTPGDLAFHFSANHAGAGNKYSEVATGGLNGSGAVASAGATDGTHTSAVYDLHSFDFSSTGDSVTVSQYFLRQDATLLITNFSIPQIGIFTDSTEMFGNNNPGNSYASLRLLSSTANSTDVFLQTEVKSGTGLRQQGAVPGTVSLTAGHWYRLTTTIENVSGTQVQISGALEDWGATGSSLLSTLLTLGASDPAGLATFAGTDLVNGDATVWAGWRSFREGGAALVDDFRATPEPGTLGLLLAGASLWRRRSR